MTPNLRGFGLQSLDADIADIANIGCTIKACGRLGRPTSMTAPEVIAVSLLDRLPASGDAAGAVCGSRVRNPGRRRNVMVQGTPVDRKLGAQSGLPQVGLGTWPLLGPPCRDAVERALTLGYRHIDTAQGFDNESEIGAGLRASSVSRDRIFITTKIWVEDLDEAEVVRRCEDSLRRLGTDYLDLVLVHWPPRRVPLEVGLGALFDLKRRGTIRHVGVSNFPCRELAAAVSMGEVFCNQIEYHPYLAQPKLTTFARRNHVALVAHSPLAGGAISEDPTLVTIGDRHGKSPAQVALRWLVQQGVTAIPKAAQADHQRSNLDIFDFELDPDELDEIASLGRGLRIRDYPWSPQWDD